MPRAASSRQPANAMQIKRPSLSEITGKGSGLPNRGVLHAVEGWGKTSLGSHMAKPIFLETKGETGLETLIDAGRIGDIPHFPETQSWEDLTGAIETLTIEDHEYKTLVIDTLNGSERLCHEYVCHRDYGDDWGERGFASYARGYEVSLGEWRKFLNMLDTLRATKRMGIFLLCHTKVKPFKNPSGSDYDRYQPDVHEKTWSLTHKWADVVLFGNFETVVKTADRAADITKKGKGMGGTARMLYTERTAAYDAKNRLGLPPEIEMGDTADDAWKNFSSAVRNAKVKEPVNG
jgi:hypothetical protein